MIFKDPNLLGWLITGLYAVAALFSLRASVVARGAPRGFWAATTLLVSAVGINKQLDAQTLVRHVARGAMQAHGWYEHKSYFEVAGIALLAAVLLGAATYLWRKMRGSGPAVRWASLGLSLLAMFVVLRASSVGDPHAKTGELLPLAMQMFEAFAVAIICVAAAAFPRSFGSGGRAPVSARVEGGAY